MRQTMWRREIVYLNLRRRMESYVRSRDILRVGGSTRDDLISPKRVPVLAIGIFTSDLIARVNYYDTDIVPYLSWRSWLELNRRGLIRCRRSSMVWYQWLRIPPNMKKHPYILACVLLLLPLSLGLSLQEDDLVFDDVGEDNDNDNVPVGSVLINHHTSHGRSDRYEHGSSSRDGKRHASRVERAWGVSDSVIPVGHIFRMKIPRQAFSGSVDFYEVSSATRLILRPWTWPEDHLSTRSALYEIPDEKNIRPTLLEF